MRSWCIVINPSRREGETQAAAGSRHCQARRKRREVKRRPIPGNSPNDRILHGPDCNRPKRVCVDSFPAAPQQIPRTQKVPGMRLLGMAESITPMKSFQPIKAGAGLPPPVGRRRGPAKERAGRSAPCSSSVMSSGRLFLDRGARQHCPSLLHRQPNPKTLDRTKETEYYRMVTASFPSCLTEGVHPMIRVDPRSSAFFSSGPVTTTENGRVGGDPKAPLPSSNRTCGFPASGSPENLSQRLSRGVTLRNSRPSRWRCS